MFVALEGASLRNRRYSGIVSLVLVAVVGVCTPAGAAPIAQWARPVAGEVAHPFEAPRSRFGAGHRGVDLAAAPGTPARAAGPGVVSFAGSVAGALHVVVAHAGGLRTSYSFLATIAGGGHDPVEAFESEEMRQVLADAINRMPDRERLVLTLYYYEGLTLAEIGNVLGVTESRVCQIHTKAIFQLRSRLSEPLPERGIVT